LGSIVRSEYFDYFMGLFLMLNAVSIGVQVNYMAVEAGNTTPLTFRAIDWAFCCVFTAELSSRLAVHGRALYSMKGWKWNVFDTVVVFNQIVDELTMLTLAGTEAQGAIENLGFLKMLRLGRILRLIRMVRLIPELKSMVYLIAASLGSFFWTLMLLILMMFCVAVHFTEAAGGLAKDWAESGDHDRALEIRKYWGSVTQSMLSLYQAITGGESWRTFVAVFDYGGSYVTNTLIFSTYIAFAVLVMLNLVTGVFVEGAQRIIKEDRDNELVRQVCKLFILTDDDASHTLSWTEFEEHLEDTQMDIFFEAVDLNRQHARVLFDLLDADNSGTLSVEEFVRGCLRLKGPARSIDLANLVQNFEQSTQKVNLQLESVEKNLSEGHRFLSSTLANLSSKVEHMQRRPWQRPPAPSGPDAPGLHCPPDLDPKQRPLAPLGPDASGLHCPLDLDPSTPLQDLR